MQTMNTQVTNTMHTITIKLTPDEYKALAVAASAAGMSIKEFVVFAVMKEAKRIVGS